MNAIPQPGWYDDPEVPAQLRFWDGASWTAQTAPAPLAETQAATPTPGETPSNGPRRRNAPPRYQPSAPSLFDVQDAFEAEQPQELSGSSEGRTYTPSPEFDHEPPTPKMSRKERRAEERAARQVHKGPSKWKVIFGFGFSLILVAGAAGGGFWFYSSTRMTTAKACTDFVDAAELPVISMREALDKNGRDGAEEALDAIRAVAVLSEEFYRDIARVADEEVLVEAERMAGDFTIVAAAAERAYERLDGGNPSRVVGEVEELLQATNASATGSPSLQTLLGGEPSCSKVTSLLG